MGAGQTRVTGQRGVSSPRSSPAPYPRVSAARRGTPFNAALAQAGCTIIVGTTVVAVSPAIMEPGSTGPATAIPWPPATPHAPASCAPASPGGVTAPGTPRAE